MSTDRRVFKYNDGRGDAFADPLAVYRRFQQATGGDPEPLLERARQVEGETPERRLSRLEAEGELAEAGRAALAMAPFDRATGEGATEEDCLTALYQWLTFLEGKGGRAGS